MGFAPIVGLGIVGLNDATALTATVYAQRDDLLVEGRPSAMRGDRRVCAGVAQENPTWPVNVAHRGMLTFTIGREVGDLSILEPAFDDVILVWIGLADAHIDIAAVGIDRHVTMARTVMLGPMLKLRAVNGEDVSRVGPIKRVLKTPDVSARRRNRAVSIPAGKIREFDIRIFSPFRNVVGKGDQRAGTIGSAHDKPVAVMRRISFVRSELEVPVVTVGVDNGLGVSTRPPRVDLIAVQANHQRGIGRVPLAFIGQWAVKQRFMGLAVQKAQSVAAVDDDQKALIRVPRLRTGIPVRAIGRCAGNSGHHRPARFGNLRKWRAENRITDRLEIAWVGHERRGNDAHRRQPVIAQRRAANSSQQQYRAQRFQRHRGWSSHEFATRSSE